MVAGLLALALSLLGSWAPSYWADEVATLQAARLPLADLFVFLSHKDAVHGAYYLLMHGWIVLFGDSPFATRFPSALAVAFAAAGIVVLGNLLGNRRLGVLSAVVFMALPRSTFMAIEARSYAISTALAVLTTVICVLAARRRSFALWALYGFVATIAAYVFLYSLLLLAAHFVYLLLTKDARSAGKQVLAAAVATAASLPLLFFARQQRGQIAWLADEPSVNVWTVLVEPWFDTSWAAAAFVLVGLLVILLRKSRSAVRGMPRGVALGLAWVGVPVVLLLCMDAAIGPLYTSRYLSFTSPGLALMLASMLISLGGRRFTAVLVLTFCAVSSFTYVAQRLPFAKNGGSDLGAIAEVISQRAEPGDAFFLQNDGPPTLRPRLALNAYPRAFAGLEDVAFVRSDILFGTFPDVTLPADAIDWAHSGDGSVWVAISAGDSTGAADVMRVLADSGYSVESSYELHRSTVFRFER